MKKYLLTFIFLTFISCSEAYEQNYDSYAEFSKANQRNKGWFPEIIFSDAKNLKNCSYLSSHTVFGSFNYTNHKKYDSIFLVSDKVDKKSLRRKLLAIEKLRPDWIENTNSIKFDSLELVKFGHFYLAKNNSKSKILYWNIGEKKINGL
ncbi:MAG: hypothetical protein R2805_09255 [Flavobacterium sp.]|uniref:hypothetical protein n=1 Tax=Flavobacterium sp. TaxID=239 RepID=UPI0035294495